MASPPPEKAVPIAAPLDGEESKSGFAPLPFTVSCNIAHGFLLYYQRDSYTTLSVFLSLLTMAGSTVAVWCYHADRRNKVRSAPASAAVFRRHLLDSIWPWALGIFALNCLLAGLRYYWIDAPSSDNACACTIQSQAIDEVHWKTYATRCSASAQRNAVANAMASYLFNADADICGVQCLRMDPAGSWVGHVSLTPADTPVDGTYCGTKYSFGRCAPVQ
ncbi:hypothetical protein FA10DRAFT_268210 [Acaromyces ingoldii]|uniref:Secreted protein CSS2 C-terminal domain-containing protein n=1 Tax=Acaromyces ingoldii TaxID=215250 RepID=A0A316YJT7_9BASI|nr:hypothetical protein FA10DRAFT_268210 [Acaromyces ingoldii]PWN89687.1 hypothetical protein FA10DRAFT_268210 [Acaromyces ingoldii]